MMENDFKIIVILLLVQFGLANCRDKCDIVKFCDVEDHSYIIAANHSTGLAGHLNDLNVMVVNCSLGNMLCSKLCCRDSMNTSAKCANSTSEEEDGIRNIFNEIKPNVSTAEKCDCNKECSTKVLTGVFLPYTIASAISFGSLLITVLVYLSIKSLRNLHGKILLGYASSLLLSQGFHLTIQIYKLTEGSFCNVAGYVLQYSLLSMFFWLNVTCYNVYRTLTGYHSLHCNEKMYHKKFIVFCLYCWGCPCILTTITLTIDNINTLSSFHSNIGVDSCFIGGQMAKFYHFYSFVSLIMLINVVFFVRIVFLLIKRNKTNTAIFNTQDSKIHNARESKRFYLYLKLSIIMGITWLLEVISFYENNNENTFWITVDTIVTSHGVLIFLLYVCNRKVLNLLRNKIYNFRKLPLKNSSTMPGCNTNKKNNSTSYLTIRTSITTAENSQ